MSSTRINKTISDLPICSRRKAELLIKEKKILSNRIIAEVTMKFNPKIETIKKETAQSYYEILMMEVRDRKKIQFNSFFASHIINSQIKYGTISVGELKEGEFRRIIDYRFYIN